MHVSLRALSDMLSQENGSGVVYWRDVKDTDVVTAHISERDGQQYLLVNGGSWHWLNDEEREARMHLRALMASAEAK